MARRRKKKLNKRVAILLGSIGALVIALVGVTVFSSSVMNKLFPKDPAALMEQANKAAEEGDRKAADKAYNMALGFAADQRAPKMPEYCIEAAKFNQKWAIEGTGLTETQRREKFRKAIALARKALLLDATYAPAQEFLADTFWDLNVGSRTQQGRDWNAYIKEADALIKLKPDDSQAYYRRAVARAEMVSPESPGEDAKQVRKDFDKAIGLDPNEPKYWTGLIQFMNRIPGKETEIEGTFKKAIAANPDDSGLLINFAGFLRKENRPEDALKQLELAVQKDPVLGNIALADYYNANKEKPKALGALDKAIQADPLDIRAYVGKVALLGAEKKNTEALAVIDSGLDALKKAPRATQPAEDGKTKKPSGVTELTYLKANVLLDMVEMEHRDPNDPERKKLLKQVDECYPLLAASKISGPMRSRLTGRMAVADGRVEEGLKDLEDCYKGTRKFDLKVANLLINIYLHKNLPGKAEAIIDRLLRMQPNNVGAMLLKIKLLMRYRDYENAERWVAGVLKLEPENEDALNVQAALRAVRGEDPKLPEGVKPDPQTLGLLLNRATAMWLDGQRDDAIKYVEKLRKVAPENRLIFSRLFSMYRAVNRIDDAEKLVDNALQSRPDDKTLVARKKLLREKDPNTQYSILMSIADEYTPPQRELEKAAVALSFGKQDDYVKYLDEAYKVDPNNIGVVERLMSYAIAKNDWDKAEQCVKRATEFNLDGCNGKLYRMRLDTARKNHDAVIDTGLEILKKDPNRKDARCLLGQAYLRKHFFEQAYDSFKIVHDNDPAYPAALVGLVAATSPSGLNRESEYRAYVRAAHRLVPGDQYVQNQWLELEQATTSPEDLILKRERALRQSPRDMRNVARLGALYERVGRFDDAEKMFMTLYQKASEKDKLRAAGILCGFYMRRNRPNDVARIMDPMLGDTGDNVDKVGVRVLYAELLTRTDPAKAKTFLETAITVSPSDPRGHLGLARFYASQKAWSDAAKAMNEYVRLRPEDIGGLKELIRYSIEAGEFESAAQRIAVLLKADPQDAAGVTLKGMLAMRKGKVEDAIGLFNKAIELSPTYAEPLIYRAQLYLAKGDNVRAKSDLAEAKRLTNRLDVAMQLGIVYEMLGEEDNAELVYREVRGDRPDYVPAITRLAGIYLRRQKWRDMEKLLDEAKKEAPDNPVWFVYEAQMCKVRANVPGMLKALAESVRLAPDNAGYLQSYLSNLASAKQYDNVLKISEPYMSKPGFSGWVGAIRAGALFKLNRLDEADQLFLASLNAIQPNLVILFAKEMQNAYGTEGAISKFRQWMENGVNNWRANLVLGMLYSESGKLDDAVKTLTKARDLSEGLDAKYLANRYLGSAYYQLKQFDKCKDAYVAAISNRKNDFQVANNLAYLYTNDLDDPKNALPFAQQAARLASSDSKVLDTYGWTLAKLKRMAEAEQVLIRAVQLESPLAVSRYHLGWVYEQLGRLEDARKQYIQGVTMLKNKPDDPDYITLKKALERVTQNLERGSAR